MPKLSALPRSSFENTVPSHIAITRFSPEEVRKTYLYQNPDRELEGQFQVQPAQIASRILTCQTL
jgi:hypothetical protein